MAHAQTRSELVRWRQRLSKSLSYSCSETVEDVWYVFTVYDRPSDNNIREPRMYRTRHFVHHQLVLNIAFQVMRGLHGILCTIPHAQVG